MTNIANLAKLLIAVTYVIITSQAATAQDEYDVNEHYTKQEYYIPMRDGTKLFTSVYTPKDNVVEYPILLKRTPYLLRPYGVNNYLNYLGPNGGDNRFSKDGYIFVYQDVRGKNMSEGDHSIMTPHYDNKGRVSASANG